MIVVKLKDQLGNQMFAYAAVKSIALQKGLKFGFYRVPLESKYINDTDKKYGNDLFTVFDLPQEELVDELPAEYSVYKERPMHERGKADYIDSVFSEVTDNCVMDGHFISSAYFKDCIDDVRKWFVIPQDIQSSAEKKISDISENGKYKVVTVHFRVGKDYTKLGYRLNKKYWWEAADKILKMYSNVKFVCVYDRKTSEISQFMEEFKAIESHGSLLEDMALISNADVNIVCNSTFSVMSALLNGKAETAICPKKYPTQAGYMPDDVFPSDWIHVGDGKRNLISGVCYRIHCLRKMIAGRR